MRKRENGGANVLKQKRKGDFSLLLIQMVLVLVQSSIAIKSKTIQFALGMLGRKSLKYNLCRQETDTHCDQSEESQGWQDYGGHPGQWILEARLGKRAPNH